MLNLRDILYFDFDKAASLISQIEGGLSQNRTEGTEGSSARNSDRKYDFLKVFRAEFGEIESEKRTILETKILHHDLLQRLENILFEENVAIDMDDLDSSYGLRALRERISGAPYLRATGWCGIEDFDRIYEISKHFNSIFSFVQRSSLGNDLQIDEIKAQIDELASEKGRNSKEVKVATSNLQKIEKQIKDEIEARKLPQWLFDGIQIWIDTLARHRLNLRVVPFESIPEMQIICNLKRNCFVDDDLEHVLYGYGSQPNKKLTVFGLVTSVPPEKEESQFNMYESHVDENPEIDVADVDHSEENGSEIKVLEAAWRALFPAIQGLEKFTSYHHYPRIVLNPIAVYLDVATSQDVKNIT